MPWQEKSAERLRMEFVVAHESQQYSFTELCELFGISRKQVIAAYVASEKTASKD